MAGFRCTACDFAFQDSGESPRCPRCLRRSGVQAEGARAQTARPQGGSPVWLIVGLALALAELAALLDDQFRPPDGPLGLAVIAAWLTVAAIAATLVIIGLRGVLARMD